MDDFCIPSACTQTTRILCNLNQGSGKEDVIIILAKNGPHLLSFFIILVVTFSISLLQVFLILQLNNCKFWYQIVECFSLASFYIRNLKESKTHCRFIKVENMVWLGSLYLYKEKELTGSQSLLS